MKYLVCDFESTNKESLLASIITGYFIYCDEEFNIIDEYSLKCRPLFWDSAAEYAAIVHGITKEKAATFPSYNEEMNKLVDWINALERCHFVAHANRTIFGKFTTYDYSLLTSGTNYIDRHFEIYEKLPSKYIVSTHSLAKYLKLPCEYNLKDLSSYLGVKLGSHHDAKDDAFACYEILKKLIPRCDINEFLLWENFKLGDTNERNTKATSSRTKKRANLADI